MHTHHKNVQDSTLAEQLTISQYFSFYTKAIHCPDDVHKLSDESELLFVDINTVKNAQLVFNLETKVLGMLCTVLCWFRMLQVEFLFVFSVTDLSGVNTTDMIALPC